MNGPAILEGLLTGAAMIIFIGPVLFTLLNGSISHGFKGGALVALGIIISDVLAVILLSQGAKALLQSERSQFWLALVGGIILVVMGLKYLIKPNIARPTEQSPGAMDLSGLFMKGFLVNFVNPFVFIVWLGLLAYGHQRFDSANHLYILGVLIGIFATDLLKAYYAGKLRKWLSDKMLKRVFIVIGIGLLLFSIRLFQEAWLLN